MASKTCAVSSYGAGWNMVAVEYFWLGRTGQSDGPTEMLVKAEDGGDFSDDDIGA